MRLFRILVVAVLAVAVWAADARAAVPADAVPDAPSSFSVRFDARNLNVRAVVVRGVVAGERVALACRDCLGQTQVQAVAGGARHVFRPNLRLNRASRLTITVTARNFARTREFRVAGSRLRPGAQRCASVAEHRGVSCGSMRAARPWATVNVCTPSRVGVRAASPGGGRARYTVAARFRLQYADGTRWVNVPSGTSPWTQLGRADRAWQGGYTFRFSSVKGRTLRGITEFEWRRGGSVVRRAVRFASPRRVAGYSSSVCAP